MVRGERIKLKAREPIDLAAAGPSGTSILRVKVRTGAVYVRGDAEIADLKDDELGYELVPAERLEGIELATNGSLFIVSSADAEIDVLTMWTA